MKAILTYTLILLLSLVMNRCSKCRFEQLSLRTNLQLMVKVFCHIWRLLHGSLLEFGVNLSRGKFHVSNKFSRPSPNVSVFDAKMTRRFQSALFAVLFLILAHRASRKFVAICVCLLLSCYNLRNYERVNKNYLTRLELAQLIFEKTFRK